MRGKAARAGLAVVLAGAVVTFNASLLRAGDNDITIDEGTWNRVMTRLGLKKPPDADSDIDYTERSPLVVPRTRDLPQPGTLVASPAADWPVNAKKHHKHTSAKAPLIPDTAVQTPNPPFVKKPWYNPAGWFDKEEYASFPGEPMRQNLTDPPEGYRVPSADQPYGINPEKKPKKKGVATGTAGQTDTKAAAQNPPPAAPQSTAAPAPAPQAAAPSGQPGAPVMLGPQTAH
jgi:hypothetical protein